ncbi:MAG: GntR family transcriptional regulator [Planctomycetota bacterium]
MLVIRLDSPLSLVEQLVVGLRTAIASQELRPGDALPTVRQLAADLGINLNTVARAYRTLESCGLVTTVRGRGTVVTAAQERQARPPAELAQRLREVLADARLAGLDRAAAQRLVLDELSQLWPESQP